MSWLLLFKYKNFLAIPVSSSELVSLHFSVGVWDGVAVGRSVLGTKEGRAVVVGGSVVGISVCTAVGKSLGSLVG